LKNLQGIDKNFEESYEIFVPSISSSQDSSQRQEGEEVEWDVQATSQDV